MYFINRIAILISCVVLLCLSARPAHSFIVAGTTTNGTTVSAFSQGGAQVIVGPNEGTTGTTANLLVKLTGAPSTAIITSTSDVTNILGPCASGCGIAGSAAVAETGVASCVFDGATTAGHHVINSTTTRGNCHDSGATTKPTTSQDLGYVLSTNASGGTYQYLVIPPTQPPRVSILSVGSSTALTNSANNFVSLASGLCSSGAEATCLSPLPYAGVHRNFYCVVSTAVLTGSWNFSLRINGATPASEPNCTISSGTTCSDTTDSATNNAGDTTDVLAAPTTTPTAVAVHCSWEVDAP